MLGFLPNYQPGSETKVGQLLRGMPDALQGSFRGIFQHGMVLALIGGRTGHLCLLRGTHLQGRLSIYPHLTFRVPEFPARALILAQQAWLVEHSWSSVILKSYVCSSTMSPLPLQEETGSICKLLKSVTGSCMEPLTLDGPQFLLILL